VAEYRPPANVVPMPAGGNLPDLLAAGDLAAAIGIESDSPDVAPLIPDADRAALDSVRRTGVFPINHLVVVKDELLAAHPDLAARLFAAFAEAKNRYVQALRDGAVENATDRMYADVMAVTGGDPLPYGIEPNRTTLEKLLDHAVAQKILDRRPALESLFAAGTTDLTA
jgi:4,5-dihydroxyphthalate decarboxylase